MCCDVGQVKRIDVLPDGVLLDIFDIYLNRSKGEGGQRRMEAWISLVHVCRQWRSVVFQSPRRLNLELYCTSKTPAKDNLDIWPAFPLIICGDMTYKGTDNIVAALGQSNRVCQANLDFRGSQLEEVLALMQVPFPELTRLDMELMSWPERVIPDSFLGGSAPRLRTFKLNGFAFPGLPTLLLSATHLVRLSLFNIPRSGHIAPEAMVTALSALSRLRRLILHFLSFQCRPDRESRNLPPPRRSILPSLCEFDFTGDADYLEELVARIDTPQLNKMDISFCDQDDFFDCPRLAQFIDHASALRALDNLHVQVDENTASIELRSNTYYRIGPYDLRISISCVDYDWKYASIEEVCNSIFQHLTTVKAPLFDVDDQYSELDSEDDAVDTEGTL